MPKRWKPSCFPWLGIHFLRFSIRVGEEKMSSGDVDDHALRMGVFFRLFMGPIVDVNHLHLVVLEGQLVVLRFNSRRILGQSWTESKKRKHHSPEKHGHNTPPLSDSKSAYRETIVSDGPECQFPRPSRSESESEPIHLTVSQGTVSQGNDGTDDVADRLLDFRPGREAHVRFAVKRRQR